MRKKPVILYNILFPVWILIWVPSYLWLTLIPVNYLIDRAVLFLGLGDLQGKNEYCRKHTWKICLTGFLSDFIGSLFLFVLLLIGDRSDGPLQRWIYGAAYNPYENVFSFALILIAVCISAFSIYRFDRVILEKTGIGKERARKAALILAIFTAPFLFFLPGNLLYR